MKIVKILLFVLLAYVGVVVIFESLLGYFQPANASTMTITTTDAAGNTNGRVLAQHHYNEQLYAAANHWPRAWYQQALENPKVQVDIDGVTQDYVAHPVTGAEHLAANAARPLGLGFRFLTGFPPRYFVRLEPQ